MQNFKVAIASWGPYPHGSVIADYFIRAKGVEPAALVERGVVVPTADRVNRDFVPPRAPAPATDVNADAFRELNELRKENAVLRETTALAEGRAAGAEAKVRRFEAVLAEQTDHIEQLKSANKDHQDQIEKLEAEKAALEEQLTAPALAAA